MQLMEYFNGFTLSCREKFYSQHKESEGHLRQFRNDDGEIEWRWVRSRAAKTRGRVTSFSPRSCSRLRHLLMRLAHPAGTITLAVTLTIPGCHRVEEWHGLIERFRTNLARFKIGMIWRVELQRRGVPHLHCVAVCDTIEKAGDIWYAWVRACDACYEGNLPTEQGYLCLPWSCHAGYLVYGFSCRVVSSATWYSYVAGHATKSKRSQLGFCGRQWGVFNKRYLTFTETTSATVDDKFLVFLCRCIRNRFRFSKINITKNKGCYDFFIDPSFVIRAKEWYYRDMPF